MADTTPFAHRGNHTGSETFIGWGSVPKEYRTSTQSTQKVAYWVYSYATPIAWRYVDGSWFMPPVGYSHTTTTHQRKTATLIGYPFEVKESLMVGYGHASPYGPRRGGW